MMLAWQRRESGSRLWRARPALPIAALWLGLFPAALAQTSVSEGSSSGWFPKKALVRVSLQTESSGVLVENQYVPEARVSEVAEFDGIRVGDDGVVVSFIGGYVYDLELDEVHATLRSLRGRQFPARALGVDERLRILFLKDESASPTRGFRLSQESDTTRFKLAKIVNNRLQLASPCVRSRDLLTNSPFESLIVTDLNPTPAGWRGGTSVDLHGHWLGIVTHDARHKASRRLAVCQLLPANVIVKALRQIESGIQRIPAGWLGVYLEQAGDETWIKDVEKGSPADKSGLRAGDLITRVDGYDFKSAPELATAIRWKGPGSQCRLTIERDDVEMQVVATLGHRKIQPQTGWRMELPHEPSRQDGGKVAEGSVYVYRTPLPALLAFGLSVSQLSASTARKLRPPTDGGLLVKKVAPGSRAEAAGFLTGDVILRVNDAVVKSLADVEQSLESGRGLAVKISFTRDGKLLHISVAPR